MSNLPEIKQRLDRLTLLSGRIKEQLSSLSGPTGDELKKKAKKEGTRIGVGVGVSLFGLMIAAVASLYVLGVIILLVNIALDRLWLSSLIVVGGFLLLGGVVIAIGAGVIHSSAKELSRSTEDMTGEIKKAGEEMKAEIEELQKVARRESEERQKQLTELANAAKKYSPVIIGALALVRVVRRAMKARKEKRRILKVIKLYDEARTNGARPGAGPE